VGVSQRFEICWGCIKAAQLGAARITASEVRQIVCFMQESCTVDAVILMPRHYERPMLRKYA
jgi:hypothetical protein